MKKSVRKSRRHTRRTGRNSVRNKRNNYRKKTTRKKNTRKKTRRRHKKQMRGGATIASPAIATQHDPKESVRLAGISHFPLRNISGRKASEVRYIKHQRMPQLEIAAFIENDKQLETSLNKSISDMLEQIRQSTKSSSRLLEELVQSIDARSPIPTGAM